MPLKLCYIYPASCQKFSLCISLYRKHRFLRHPGVRLAWSQPASPRCVSSTSHTDPYGRPPSLFPGGRGCFSTNNNGECYCARCEPHQRRRWHCQRSVGCYRTKNAACPRRHRHWHYVLRQNWWAAATRFGFLWEATGVCVCVCVFECFEEIGGNLWIFSFSGNPVYALAFRFYLPLVPILPPSVSIPFLAFISFLFYSYLSDSFSHCATQSTGTCCATLLSHLK